MRRGTEHAQESRSIKPWANQNRRRSKSERESIRRWRRRKTIAVRKTEEKQRGKCSPGFRWKPRKSPQPVSKRNAVGGAGVCQVSERSSFTKSDDVLVHIESISFPFYLRLKNMEKSGKREISESKSYIDAIWTELSGEALRVKTRRRLPPHPKF